MAVLYAIAFATFFLEHDDLFALYEGLGHFAYYFYSFNCGSTDFHVTVGVDKQHLVKIDAVTFFDICAEEVNVEELAGFCLELLSLNFYDSVPLVLICILS